ncbi:family 43 glycosylhydrolase [Streptomyces sp. 3MP-14]|uniref:Family 43 glycosylhydrolase n=1 Tax=Streptomyces mimosae TaxID=2586635 RepID=A0A5N6AGM6_9ACTN|nr:MULTISPECIES: glycoside hydrolase family 43 protein [Streptomyces]KAB8166959.1 family 43 glycosylhydrolase [Streptomyces mimosae]KAB8176900.1 family 43 glycosylhydrolase [Streptomyces sp. 3MP-14]
MTAAPAGATTARNASTPGRTAALRNPVLPGFHPDPSILRVGPDYYVATSTFEWCPGVRLHHSRDLVNWTPIGGALTDERLLPMAGNPDSGGVWAPCLSHADGLFHLVWSNVRSLGGAFKDVRNYVATAPHPTGPWSDPVEVHGAGFDPSLFHDEDGRSWLLAMRWDHRPGHDPFGGIVIQEWDRARRTTTGPLRTLWNGGPLGRTEGPHLYRRDGWYYLMVAEGGTGYEHAVTVARARTLDGPWEADPAGAMLTSYGTEATLQKAGHGCLVSTEHDEWYLAHLCARPLTPGGRCVLGRETAIQRVTWTEDGWPRLADGGRQPHEFVTVPGTAEPATVPAHDAPFADDFTAPQLRHEWATLRIHPSPDWLSLTERPGALRLRGQESPASTHRQSLVARRQQHHACRAEVTVEFAPTSPQQFAGLIHYYNSQLWHYLHITRDEELGQVLRLGVYDNGGYSEPAAPVELPDPGPVRLRLDVAGATGTFAYALDPKPGGGTAGGAAFQPVGPPLDVTRLSDEYAVTGPAAFPTTWGFTGAFIGMAAHDLTREGATADFTAFRYLPGPPQGVAGPGTPNAD